MKTVTAFPLTSRRLDVPDSFAAVQAYYEERGWTDGLPVVPATEDLVWEMLGTFGQNLAHVLGVIQPRNARVTLEKIAVNAVMAGCRPEHFPVVVSAVRAILQLTITHNFRELRERPKGEVVDNKKGAVDNKP